MKTQLLLESANLTGFSVVLLAEALASQERYCQPRPLGADGANIIAGKVLGGEDNTTVPMGQHMGLPAPVVC